MDIRDYLEVVRRRWLSIVVVVLATLGVAAGITLLWTPQYTATTKLFFAVQGGESGTDLAQGSNFTEKQMSSYAQVVTSPLVLDRVINELDLNTTSVELANSVTGTPTTDTVILEISVTDPNPQQAALIANSTGDNLVTVTGGLTPERPDGTEAVRATILAKAQVPTSPSSPIPLRNLAVGLLLGLMLGIAVALLRHASDTKVRSEQDVQAISTRAVLGVIPFDVSAPSHPVVLRDDPMAARSEAIRRLRTNLQFVDVGEGSKSILVSSSIPGEGKTTTAMNLAVAIADANLRVILIDADLRRPSIADYLGLEGSVGLTTVLIGQAELSDVVQPWQGSTLDILPAGQVPPNPSELLGSRAMASLLAQLTENYDMVIFDSPPLLPVTDAAVLSKLVGGTLLVVGADRTQRPQLREAIESLDTVGANILGIVLNKIAKRDSSAYIYDGAYRSYKSHSGEQGPGHGDSSKAAAATASPAPSKTPSLTGDEVGPPVDLPFEADRSPGEMTTRSRGSR